ncbi:MAG: hypothetical protein QNJ68_12755 [Microcoleaceae cyanobacterium MO_207.B10]|nr:hypothetical protein [Microcoleaceae cyanobacterium MO_207.B10]
MNFCSISKQILTAIAGATVSLGTTFSLLAPRLQAANFTTTFTDGSDSSKWVKLFWSGEDQQKFGEEGYGLISGEELLGVIIIEDYEGQKLELSVSDLERKELTFDLSDLSFQLDNDNDLDLSFPIHSVGIFNVRSEKYGGAARRTAIVWEMGPYHVGSEIENYKVTTTTTTAASHPEPSLTLGFITLGGLVLGGTIKNRKAKG